VGTWAYAFVELPYEPCNIDFVTVTPRSREIVNMRMDEEFWKDFVRKIREKLGSIPIFAFIDWSASDNAPMAVFSQKLTPVQQREMLKIMDNFFTKKCVVFVYPVHGGSMGKNARRLSFGKYIHYDALTPDSRLMRQLRNLFWERS